MSAEFRDVELEIPQELNGLRLDIALARMLPEHSRTRIKGWIEAGHVQIGRLACKPKDVVSAGSRVRCVCRWSRLPRRYCRRRYRSRSCTKTATCWSSTSRSGWWCIPGAGNPRHTLQNALLGWDPRLAALPRAGIIHRLDKDTSGLLVVARTPEAHTVAEPAARWRGRSPGSISRSASAS